MGNESGNQSIPTDRVKIVGVENHIADRWTTAETGDSPRGLLGNPQIQIERADPVQDRHARKTRIDAQEAAYFADARATS